MRRPPLVTAALLAVVILTMPSTAADPPAAAVKTSPPVDRLPAVLSIDAIPLGLEKKRPLPEDNQLTEQRVQLGRRLFFDGRLSANGKLSCASCHDPAHGFADPNRVSTGVGGKKGTRNSPSVLNRAFGKAFFWDGRAGSLEEQALKPIENPIEMATTVKQVIEKLKADPTYVKAFEKAYEGGVTAKNLARALASFQRVLLSGESPLDQFIYGEYTALTASQRKGMWIFDSKGGCWQCHSGRNYSDEAFHNTGVSWGRKPLDLGRFEVTKEDADRGRFKTPSLRDVSRTAPYMHDGSIATLRQAVEFYNRGGVKNLHLDRRMKPLNLSKQEIDDLTAFLQALTGKSLMSD